MNKKMLSAFLVIMSLENMVCASNVSNSLPKFKEVNPVNYQIIGLIEIFSNIFPPVLIFYTILKCIKLKALEKEAIKNGEEIKKEKCKYIFVVKNIMLALFFFMVSSLFGILQDKPVIYIYPETETTVQVSVGYPEKLSCVYPEYDAEKGWEVIAKPNGDLVDTKTGRNLYCLYWEGNQKQNYKFKDGFVVAGEDSAKFLEEKLAILGLNEREANEFIIYWLPKLEANKYNLIRFETAEEIEEYMPLYIEPKPDSAIRISMNFKSLKRPIEIEEQKLETPIREGYTVVEWGGSEF